MSSRCSKCGRNNYGDVQKCSFCGAPLVFIPGEEIPEITEEDVQEKLSQLKVDRIRNPLVIGGGGIVAVIGVFLALVLFFVFMIFVFSPSNVGPYTDAGSFHYDVPGGEEYVFGEITKVVEDSGEAETESYGYIDGYFAYEIDGDGADKRKNAHEAGTTDFEPDLWVYSEDEIGEKGDRVLIKVVSKTNSYGELRAVSEGKAGWGGSGWFSGGWIFLLPGFLLFLGGLIVLALGLIGKSDKSMDRLMEEDKEFRRQQLMLREAARKQMEAQRKQQEWTSYNEVVDLSGEEASQPVQPLEGQAAAYPTPATPAPMQQMGASQQPIVQGQPSQIPPSPPIQQAPAGEVTQQVPAQLPIPPQ